MCSIFICDHQAETSQFEAELCLRSRRTRQVMVVPQEDVQKDIIP